MRVAGLLFLLLFIFPALAARKGDDNLTQKEAQARKAQVKSIEYDLFFELHKDSPGFKGRAILKVELNRTDLPLSIDTMAKTIKSVRVNGKALRKYPKRKGSFDVPSKNLAPHMEIEIDYENDYAKAAGGLIRSKDPVDGSEYIYTDFEPYYAHNLFPSFDQPDLKAHFKVTVLAPLDWKVIQNELEESSKAQGEKTLTVFKKTPKISTYLFFLGAGPFHQWTDFYGDLPLHLFARKSLVKYVDADNIFRTTKAGLKFFNDYFGYSYPFSKYGQLFIPDFAWGGMENPGAVTLNERNIFRGEVPAAHYAKRDNLILHEMAHMWFGDLVTMVWWNDLWLNESFATYLATLAQERALSSEATWISFMNTKAWGYWQDQLVTTHPIETEVPDVRTAKGNFDGITYAKGASALKQLHFFVGEEGFREGLRTYFKTFAFKNTLRSDFIGAIARASGKDLNNWTEKWLQTAGPNFVALDFDCEEGKVKKAIIKQRRSVSKNLSPHRAKFAFFGRSEGKLSEKRVFEASFTGEETQLDGAVGVDCPEFVLPNLDDKDYAIYSLDKRSVLHVKEALSGLADPLSRFMLWETIHQMLRETEISSKNYFETALEALGKEENDLLIGFLLGRRSSFRSNYHLYLTKEERASFAPGLEEVLWKRVAQAKEGSSLQMAFFDFLVGVSSTKHSLDKLHSMLIKNKPPAGITLGQDRRWAIILTLAMNGHPEAMTLRDEEVKKDPSILGKRMAFAMDAARPEKTSKDRNWKQFFNKKGLNYSDFNEAAQYIHGHDFPELSIPFVEGFFKKVTSMDWKSHDDIVDIYFERLFPLKLCTDEVLNLSMKKIKSAKNLTVLAKRSWLEAQDELSRCVRVRKSKLTAKK